MDRKNVFAPSLEPKKASIRPGSGIKIGSSNVGAINSSEHHIKMSV